MSELLKLAELCEQASGPDRELDCLIAVAIDWRWSEWEEGEPLVSALATKHGIEWLVKSAQSGMSIWRNIPCFTASIDATMKLVPEEWFIDLSIRPAPMRPSAAYTRPQHVERGIWYRVEATTPALALCAAALRARTSSETDHG